MQDEVNAVTRSVLCKVLPVLSCQFCPAIPETLLFAPAEEGAGLEQEGGPALLILQEKLCKDLPGSACCTAPEVLLFAPADEGAGLERAAGTALLT